MRQYIEINGAPATVEDLAVPALVNYGHFTYGQVRGHALRGLDLHLERLDRGTRELFGRPLDGGRVRAYARRALRHTGGDATLRVQVFTRDVEALTGGLPAEPDVMTVVRDPASPDGAPRRLRSVGYERPLSGLKHAGTLGIIHHGRRARQDGYDDALLTDRAGHVTESAVANVCLHDGDRFVWPASEHAPGLPGIMRGLLRRGMRSLGVPYAERAVHLSELPELRAAFLTNSIHPAVPVASVDGLGFAGDEREREAAGRLLREAYEANPWERV